MESNAAPNTNGPQPTKEHTMATTKTNRKAHYAHATQDGTVHTRSSQRTYTHVVAVQEQGGPWFINSYCGSRALADKAATTLRNKIAKRNSGEAVSVEAINHGTLPDDLTATEVHDAIATMLSGDTSIMAAANVAKVERKAKAMARAAATKGAAKAAAAQQQAATNATAKAGSSSKVCRVCGERKNLDAFGANASTKDGLRAFCKSCAAARVAARKAAKAAQAAA